MRKCIKGEDTTCPFPIAECKPLCKDSTKQRLCTCKNKDFPENWAGPLCTGILYSTVIDSLSRKIIIGAFNIIRIIKHYSSCRPIGFE